MAAPLFSLITPSRGDRPLALGQTIDSVAAAMAAAGLDASQVEMLVGFDGARGLRPRDLPFVRWFDLPRDGDYGNRIRDTLLRIARGGRLVFLDDDNALTPAAFPAYLAHPGADMLICRIDTSRAFPDTPFLPRPDDGETVRQANVDPLCLCLSRRLVLDRCGGWTSQGGYEADFVNMARYRRRSRQTELDQTVVGVYDAGRGLDAAAMQPWQQNARGARQAPA
ncbi:MAG: glycosyl transferase family 2 [Thermodesulfobacteriota bacterium]